MRHFLRYWGRKPDDVVNAVLKDISSDLVVDPFAGSGQIPYIAALRGKHSIYVDINPYAWLVAYSNVHKFGRDLLKAGKEVLRSYHNYLADVSELRDDYLYYDNGVRFEKKRNGERVTDFFDENNFRKLYAILKAIDDLPTSDHVKLGLYAAFCHALPLASKMNRNRNERNAAGSWSVPSYWVPKDGKPVDAEEAFRRGVSKLFDTSRERGDVSGKVKLLLGDALSFNYPKDAALVTDPPYFDEIQYAELSFFYWAWLRESKFPEIVRAMAGLNKIEYDFRKFMNVSPVVNVGRYLVMFKQFLRATKHVNEKVLFFHDDDSRLLRLVLNMVKEEWGNVRTEEVEIKHRDVGARGSNKYLILRT